MIRKIVAPLIFFSMLLFVLNGCTSNKSNALTKGNASLQSSPIVALTLDEARNSLAKYHNTLSENIQLVALGTPTNNSYVVSYRMKQNNQWEPSDTGFFMAVLSKNLPNDDYSVKEYKYD